VVVGRVVGVLFVRTICNPSIACENDDKADDEDEEDEDEDEGNRRCFVLVPKNGVQNRMV